MSHFIIISDKNILCEYCKYPYNTESLRLLFSVTKSITSLAVGIAYDKRLLSLDDYVYKFFDDRLPKSPHPNMFKIKIKHLLTMSSGIDYNTYPELVTKSDWIAAFLEQEFPNEPGTKYLYSTHASHMLSAIITAVSGQSLEAFLNENLFFDIGITNVQWEHSPEGLTAGGMGLSLTPGALIKIARLLLNNGAYNGKQLISQKYLSCATALQIEKQQNDGSCFKGTGYGYQFHIAKDGYYYLDGAFGQLILVCPDKKQAFIAFSNNSKNENLLAEIYKHFIYDNFEQEKALPSSQNNKTFNAVSFPDDSFTVGNNPLSISSVRIKENKVIFTDLNGRENIIKFDFIKPALGKAYFIKDLQEHKQEYVSEMIYASENRLALRVYWIETPYIVTYEFEFNSNSLTFKFDINVSFTLNKFEIKGNVK